MKFTPVRPRMIKALLRRAPPPKFPKRQDYSACLYADMWIEPSGMSLSVNSAFARLNLDPWREANRLASMERTPAALVLSRAIAGLLNRPASADAVAIAARLIKLLPERAACGAGNRRALHAGAPRSWVPRLTAWRFCLILALAYLVAYAWFYG